MTTVPDPYDRDVFRGRLMDFATQAAVLKVEHRLGYELTILQAVGLAPASGNTHAGRNGEGGRAVDMAFWDIVRKMRAWRDLVGPHWPREMLPGVWGEHGHALTIFIAEDNRRGISDAGFDQIGKYNRKEDGLANPPTPDPNPYRPKIRPVMSMDEYRFIITGGLDAPQPNNVTRTRDALVTSMQDLREAIALAGKTPEEREKVHDLIDDFRRIHDQLENKLRSMPPR